jgi:hypothetical protein
MLVYQRLPRNPPVSIAHARPDFIAVANPSLVKSACVVHAEMDIPFICGPYNGQIISGYALYWDLVTWIDVRRRYILYWEEV